MMLRAEAREEVESKKETEMTYLSWLFWALDSGKLRLTCRQKPPLLMDSQELDSKNLIRDSNGTSSGRLDAILFWCSVTSTGSSLPKQRRRRASAEG